MLQMCTRSVIDVWILGQLIPSCLPCRRWAWGDALGRSEAAHCHRTRPDQEPQDPHPRRGHQRTGRRVRECCAGGPGPGHNGPHCPHHRPPPQHYPGGWPDLCHEQRPYRGGEEGNTNTSFKVSLTLTTITRTACPLHIYVSNVLP